MLLSAASDVAKKVVNTPWWPAGSEKTAAPGPSPRFRKLGSSGERGHYLPRLRVHDGDDGTQRDAFHLYELSLDMLRTAWKSLESMDIIANQWKSIL